MPIRRFSRIVGMSIYASLIVLILFISIFTDLVHNRYYPLELAFDLIDLALAMIPIYLLIVMKAAFHKIPAQGYISSVSFLFSAVFPSISYLFAHLSYQYLTNPDSFVWAITGIIWIISGITIRQGAEED
ncbi:hypothetical protein [Thermoplasma sp.]|uniref:hypothetical protein n=1 Tax=Thermoplasma sp. TaxID=1973142 RepID=UPI00127013EC|nr:hypothetical protein [Thermoplasma sp.]KAA8922163.1 MAG: hypothetical protein F6Q11_05710 [Thermoplasma sp.]